LVESGHLVPTIELETGGIFVAREIVCLVFMSPGCSVVRFACCEVEVLVGHVALAVEPLHVTLLAQVKFP
jgi:hypothetical protein